MNNKGTIKSGGGLCIYVREGIEVLHLETSDRSDGNIEITNLGIKKNGNRKFVFSAVYRPPTGKIDEFHDELECVLDEVHTEFGGDSFIMGDMNVDFVNTNSSQFKKLKARMDKSGLTQLVKDNTRITSRKLHEN